MYAYQDLRSVFHAVTLAAGRATAARRVLDSFHRCPIPEVPRRELLAYLDDDPGRYGICNGGTEAINLIIEKTRRLAHGFGNLRIRILLAADGTRPWRRRQCESGGATHPQIRGAINPSPAATVSPPGAPDHPTCLPAPGDHRPRVNRRPPTTEVRP